MKLHYFLTLLLLAPLTGCASLAAFINLPASQFQVSTIQFCGTAPALLKSHAADPQLAAAVQTLCAAPPGIAPTPAQTAALATALQRLSGG